MSINEIASKIEALKEWEARVAEAAAEIESMKDAKSLIMVLLVISWICVYDLKC